MTGEGCLTRQKGRELGSTDDRSRDRAAEQRRASEETKRAGEVSRQTRKGPRFVVNRTLSVGENPEDAGNAGKEPLPYGRDPGRWQASPDAQGFPTVEAPLSEELDRGLVGRRIREAMADDGAGQLEMVRRTGISRQQMREYMNGLVMPNYRNLGKIAVALNRDIRWFLSEAEGADA